MVNKATNKKKTPLKKKVVKKQLKGSKKVQKRIDNAVKESIVFQNGRETLIESLTTENNRNFAFHLQMVQKTTGKILPEDIAYCENLKVRIIEFAVQEYNTASRN